ncbi:MAG: hypothetical protein KDD42_00435 [Bdellovibrionales bacterium]|nr:hypothetical protein [Bdellovibrionales bacterium]
MFSRLQMIRESSERGASMVEYALLIALILLIAIPSTKVFTRNSRTTFFEVADAIGGGDGTGAIDGGGEEEGGEGSDGEEL